MIYSAIRLVLAILFMAFILLPINTQTLSDFHHGLLGIWWLQSGALMLYGFLLDILGRSNMHATLSTGLQAAGTFIVLGYFVFLGSPQYAFFYGGLHPFGLQINSNMFSNVGSVVVGFLTAKALFSAR